MAVSIFSTSSANLRPDFRCPILPAKVFRGQSWHPERYQLPVVEIAHALLVLVMVIVIDLSHHIFLSADTLCNGMKKLHLVVVANFRAKKIV